MFDALRAERWDRHCDDPNANVVATTLKARGAQRDDRASRPADWDVIASDVVTSVRPSGLR
jgi:hypothetical protein